MVNSIATGEHAEKTSRSTKTRRARRHPRSLSLADSRVSATQAGGRTLPATAFAHHQKTPWAQRTRARCHDARRAEVAITISRAVQVGRLARRSATGYGGASGRAAVRGQRRLRAIGVRARGELPGAERDSAGPASRLGRFRLLRLLHQLVPPAASERPERLPAILWRRHPDRGSSGRRQTGPRQPDASLSFPLHPDVPEHRYGGCLRVPTVASKPT